MRYRPNILRDYDRVIIAIFEKVFKPGLKELLFTKDDLEQICRELKINVKNIPDILYTYRSRGELPSAIKSKGQWVIEGRGKGRYAFFQLERSPYVEIPRDLEVIPIPDSTPEIILKYASTDEQSILATIRYNRLIDTFLGLTAYQLQGHFRTTVKRIGQIEIDELYLGVDTNGRWYVIPIEAKGPDPREQIGIIQVSCLTAFARQYYPELTARPVAVKAWEDGSIFLIEFNTAIELEKISTVNYKRYKLFHEPERRH